MSEISEKNENLVLLEHQMKEIWSQYVDSIEENGPNDTAQELRKKYFKIYYNYKHKREWIEALR